MFRLHAQSTVIEKCNLYNNMYVHKVSTIGSAVSKLQGAKTQKMTNVNHTPMHWLFSVVCRHQHTLVMIV